MVDQARIREAVRTILAAVGEDPDREGLKQTPARVARMFEELFSGLSEDPSVHLKALFDEQHHEVVLVRDIPFSSTCEHHLMPFTGRAHVAYIPNGKVIGISKIGRIVDAFARRLQVQERLTTQVARAIEQHLDAVGVGVVIEARHLCMMMRGVEKQNSRAVTSCMLGRFRRDARTRAEFMDILKRA